ncbi:hypothetical protein VTJ49DRAFT_6312 [Mycothermus thermophilus]|uniref:Uncharacterized protein n=1 Tax=Humicola insolens TaxID=85995 RepID=A0ABR3VLZ6_HUMIN
MSRRSDRPPVACVEDADDDGDVIEGTTRYASSAAPSSPAKEQPNTSRARKEKARKGSSSPITTSVVTDSDSTVHPRRDPNKKPSRERSQSVSRKALMQTSRAMKHTKAASLSREDDALYYGIGPTVTPAPARPRAQTARPPSYHGPTRPPPSNARFYQQPPPTGFPPAQTPPTAGWMGPPPPGPPGPPLPFGPPVHAPLVMQNLPHHHPPPPPSDLNFQRPLESRFGGRPQSSIGFRPPPPHALEYEDPYPEPIEKSLARRPSRSHKPPKDEDDRRVMPPPRRPSSARPVSLPFRPPPPAPPKTPGPLSRRRLDLDDEPDPDEGLFHDLSPAPYDYHGSLAPRPPRQSFGAEAGFEMADYFTEVGGRGRRSSFYGGNSASSGSAYEDKMRQATRYQYDVEGGPPLPLTAETLRKAGRGGGASSRSTRSSGSHDESDYRQSATTRTTAPDEGVTIKANGSTVVKYGNTELQCQEGAVINITSRSGGNPEIRNAAAAVSDRASSYVDVDDRRTRVDLPTSRARAQSRAKSRPRSFSRPLSKYDMAPAPTPRDRYEVGARYEATSPVDYHDAYSSYGRSPYPPPYPEYPQISSSYSSRHGDYFGPQ